MNNVGEVQHKAALFATGKSKPCAGLDREASVAVLGAQVVLGEAVVSGHDEPNVTNRNYDIDSHLVVTLPPSHAARVDPREVGLTEAPEVGLFGVQRFHHLATRCFDPAKLGEVSGH